MVQVWNVFTAAPMAYGVYEDIKTFVVVSVFTCCEDKLKN